MAHTYCSALFHCVFSTKGRRRSISPEIQERLWSYMGGIAREHGMKALLVNGVEDHAHLLLSIPASISVSKAIQAIKIGSSRWMHESSGLSSFAWQEGYGAFSIRLAQIEVTTAYIATQKEHHRKQNFQEEFLAFLKKHQIDFDPRFIWG